MQRFLEGAADCHRLADRLHRGGQITLGAGEFLESKARNFCDDIIDRRFEGGGCRAAGDVVFDLVERVADGKFGRDARDRKSGRLRGERRRPRHARIHLDHDHAAIGRIDGELHIRAAGLHPDLAQNRQRGIAHDLVFLVGERQSGRDRDRIARMHAHRIEILDRADDDAIVRLVADDFHFIFFPAENAFLDQDLIGRRGIDAAFDDLDEFGFIVGDATARAAHREGGADDGRQADIGQRLKRLRQRLDVVRTRRRKSDLGHCVAE